VPKIAPKSPKIGCQSKILNGFNWHLVRHYGNFLLATCGGWQVVVDRLVGGGWW